MNFQQALHNKRELLHKSLRKQIRQERGMKEWRAKFIEEQEIQYQENDKDVLPFAQALKNAKEKINFVESLRGLIVALKREQNVKQKSKMIFGIIDGAILQKIAKSDDTRVLEQGLNLVLAISSFQHKNTGNLIIRSGILLPLLSKDITRSNKSLQKLIALMGNICCEDADNRNVVADSQIHIDIVNSIVQRVKSNPQFYDENNISPEEKKLWTYRFWFLQKFYLYQGVGETYPPDFVQSLLILLSKTTPYAILERVICLVATIKINQRYYKELAIRVEILLEQGMDSQDVRNLLYIFQQYDELPIQNLRNLLPFLNPQYFGASTKQYDFQSSVTRILYARRKDLDQIAELHQQNFWTPIISKSLPSYDRYMIIEIFMSINLQNVEWVFEYVSLVLEMNRDALQVHAALDFILTQMDQKGCNIVGKIIEKTSLRKGLLRMWKSKNKQIGAKLEKIFIIFQQQKVQLMLQDDEM